MTGPPRYRAALTLAVLLASAAVVTAPPAIADDPPTVSISDTTIADPTEGNSGTKPFTFDVTLTGTVTEDVIVTAETFQGTATYVSDFTNTQVELTFTQPGTQQLSVPVQGDQVQEPDEDFTVRISSNTTDVVIADNTGVAVIVNDDGPDVRIEGPASAITEPSVDGTPRVARFTITASGWGALDDDDVAVRFATVPVDGGAEPGDDYQPVEGTATLTAPEDNEPVEFQVEVPILGDDVYEGEAPESFTVVLEDLANGVWELDGEGQPRNVATGLIGERDGPPTVSVLDTDVIEGDDGDTSTALVTVALSQRSTDPVSFTYATRDETGTGAAKASQFDYEAIGGDGSGEVPALSTSVVVPVVVLGDDLHEDNEVFHVDLALAEGENDAAVDAENGEAEVTIRNDEGVVITVDDVAELEGADGTSTPFEFTVALSEPVETAVEVTYATTDGNTFAGGDYEPVAGDLTIPAGQTSATVPVTVKGDGFAGPDEEFYLDLTATTPGFPGPTIMKARGVGTILNDDGPRITISDVTANEGDPGEGVAVDDVTSFDFTVTLSEPFTHPDLVTDVSVDFETRHVTTDDDDLDAVSGTLVIPEGETTGKITVPVHRDDTPERTERFEVVLSEAFNGYLVDGTARARGTIVNDDGPTITIAGVSIEEGDSGTTSAVFEASLSEPSSGDTVSARFATANGTATVADGDYAAKTGTLSFPPGTTDGKITIAVPGDERFEPDETFELKLSDAAFGVLAVGSVTGTIRNDDPNRPPVVTIDAPATAESWMPVELGSKSDDPDRNAIAGHAWRLGDGQTADEPQLTHVFTRSGVYEIRLTVTDEFGAKGTATAEVTVTDSGDVTRSAGSNRIATAVQASRDHWDRAENAVLATAWNYPDALAGGALAAKLGAPLLLTDADALPNDVLAELDRLDVATVWVLGGTAAVSEGVEKALTGAGLAVRRLAGDDRFATAAEVAVEVGTATGEVVLALGIHEIPQRSWPDALAAGALAATPDRIPTLLGRGDGLPAATEGALAALEAQTVLIVGGTAAIADTVQARLVELGYEVVRLAGETRYGTSAAVAREALERRPSRSVPVVYGTGENFPDGLAAAAVAARLGGVVVLVPSTGPDPAVGDLVQALAERLDAGVVVGGAAAVADAVREWLITLMVAG